MPTIPIKITATAEGVSDAFRGVRRNVEQSRAAIEGARDKTQELRKALDDARSSGASLDDITKAADDLSSHLATVEARTAQVHDRFEGLRNAGAIMAGIGAAGLALSSRLISVAEEGNSVEAQLEAVFKAQGRLNDLQTINDSIGDIAVRGHFDDDDSLRKATVLMANWEVTTAAMPGLLEAAGRQAQTTGQNVEELANAFGKAISTGNYQGLKRTAVSFSETETAAIEAAYAVSQQAGQLALVNAITAAVARTTGALGDSLTESQKAANDVARAMDDAMTNSGSGAATAKAQVDRLLFSVLSVVNASPELETSAGYFGYMGSGAATAAGTILGLTGQIGLAKMGLEAMGITGVASFRAMTAASVPLLLTVGKIALAALAIAAAMYLADKAIHAREDAELAANIKAGDDTDAARLEISNKLRAKRGQAAETMEQFKAREANSDGQNDAQDPTAQIDAIKNMMANPQGGGAGLVPAEPVMPSATESIAGALQVSDAAQSKAEKTREKSAASALKAAQREAEKKKKAAERAMTKEQKARAKAAEKWRKLKIKQADTWADQAADIAIEQLNADFDVRVAQIEAAVKDGDEAGEAATRLQIARLTAAKTLQEAKLRADGMKGEDDAGKESVLKRAQINASKILALGNIAFNKSRESDAINPRAVAAQLAANRLRGSFDLSGTSGATMVNPYSVMQANGAPGFVSIGTRGRNKPTAQIASQQHRADGKIEVQFAPIVIDNRDGLMAAAQVVE